MFGKESLFVSFGLSVVSDRYSDLVAGVRLGLVVFWCESMCRNVLASGERRGPLEEN